MQEPNTYTTADQSNAISLDEFKVCMGMGEQKKGGGKKQVAQEPRKGTSRDSAGELMRWMLADICFDLEDVIDAVKTLETRMEEYITQREGGGLVGKRIVKAAPKKSAAKAKGKIGKAVKKK